MNGRYPEIRSTTILAVRRNGRVAMAGDGQVTLGNTVVKSNARKIRKIYNDTVITGFAGATADAFTLLERFEEKVKEFSGDILRSSVELAKDWRTDKMLRKLEAMMLVANSERILLLSGTGDVIEPTDNAIAIGSGGPYAYAAAMAYLDGSELSAADIARKSLAIAGGICIYTNREILVEELP